MSQPIMKKTLLASAIAMSMVSTYGIAAVPDPMPVTNMVFDGKFYDAGGYFNAAGNIGPFDPGTNLVNDPDNTTFGGRKLASGFDPLTASGNIYSLDNFNGFPWEGEQQGPYLTNADNFAYVYDGADCATPGTVTKSSGPCSEKGSYDYDDVLAAMTDEQIAVGMFFDWNTNQGIAVLDVFNCDTNDVCTGTGIPMANGPFPDARARFNAGLSCTAGFLSTAVGTPLAIDIAADVLGTVVLPSSCINPTATGSKTNPAGLRVADFEKVSAEGGSVALNGGVLDYKPLDGFEGPDSFTINITDDTGQVSGIIFSVQVGGVLQSNFTMLDVSGGIIGGTNDVDIVWDEVTYNNPTIVPGSDTGDGFGIPAETTPVMTIASPTPFNGFNWFAKNVRVYQGPIKLKFDIACTEADYTAGLVDCSSSPLPPVNNGERYIKMDLKAGEIGGHMIFDWGKAAATTCGLNNCEIDVVNIWHVKEMWGDDPFVNDGKNELYVGPSGVTPANDAKWRLVSVATDSAVIGTKMIDGAFKGSNANFNYKPDKAQKTVIYDGTISDVKASAFSIGLWTLFASLFSVLGLRQLVKGKNKL